MNPVAALIGAIKALAGRHDWTEHFDLRKTGLQQSFVALILTIPAFYLIAHAVQLERAKVLEEAVRCSACAICDYSLALSSLFFSHRLYLHHDI